MTEKVKPTLLILFLIVFIGCNTQFSSDVYAPSLVSISNAFDTTINNSQLSLSIFMVGLALSQVFFGPLSEGIGRKKAILYGMLIMLFGISLTLCANSIEMLIFGRFIQGIGGGASASLWRAMFRDVFSGDKLAKYTSYAIICVTVIVPLAPVFGGFIEEALGWYYNFVFMFLYGLLCLVILMCFIGETNTEFHISKLNKRAIIDSYKELLASKVFLGMTLCVFVAFGSLFSWFVVAPVIFIGKLGISPSNFGLINMAISLTVPPITGMINGRYVNQYGSQNMMRLGLSFMIMSALLLTVGYLVYGVNLYAIIIPYAFFVFGAFFIFPNAYSVAFTPFGHIAGYAAALYGTMQIAGGGVLGTLMAYLPDDNQLSIALTMLITSISALLLSEFAQKK